MYSIEHYSMDDLPDAIKQEVGTRSQIVIPENKHVVLPGRDILIEHNQDKVWVYKDDRKGAHKTAELKRHADLSIKYNRSTRDFQRRYLEKGDEKFKEVSHKFKQMSKAHADICKEAHYFRGDY